MKQKNKITISKKYNPKNPLEFSILEGFKKQIEVCKLCHSDMEKDKTSTADWYRCTREGCALWHTWRTPEQLGINK